MYEKWMFLNFHFRTLEWQKKLEHKELFLGNKMNKIDDKGKKEIEIGGNGETFVIESIS